MKVEDRLRQVLRERAERVELPADAWDRIERDHPPSLEPARGQRIVAGLVSAMIALAAFAFLFIAFTGGRIVPDPAQVVEPITDRRNGALYARVGGGDVGAHWISVDVDAGGSTRVLPGDPETNFDQVSWAPDGDRIAFVNYLVGRYGLYTAAPDGTEVVRLTDGVNDSWPSWSPDGRMLAFSGTGQQEKCAPGEFASSGLSCPADIYVMDIDGGSIHRLTSDPASEWGPVWSPDAQQIAFTRVVDGVSKTGVYVMDADGTSIRPVAVTPKGSDFRPSWAPDGRSLVYASIRNEDWGIFTVDLQTGRERRLIDGNEYGYVDNPVWSPDGTLIAFVHGGDLSVMASDGSEVRTVVDARLDVAGDLAWRPLPVEVEGGEVPAGLLGEPTVSARIPYPHEDAHGGGIAVGAGSVWVGVASGERNADGSILRIDPATNEIITEIPISGPTFRHRVAATDDAVWVASTTSGLVERIDPFTNTVVASLDLGGTVTAIAADDSALWAVTIEDRSNSGLQNTGRLLRIDPETSEIVAEIPLGEAATGYEDTLMLGAGSVWMLGPRLVGEDTEKGGDLIRVDPDTNRVETTIPVDGFTMVLAQDQESIWVRSPQDDVFNQAGETWVWRRVDAVTNEVSAPFRFPSREDGGLQHVSDTALWAVGYDSQDWVRVTRFDPGTLEVVARSDAIRSLFTDGLFDRANGTVWITTLDRIVRVDIEG